MSWTTLAPAAFAVAMIFSRSSTCSHRNPREVIGSHLECDILDGVAVLDEMIAERVVRWEKSGFEDEDDL